MRNILPLAPFALVLPLGNALAAHDWLALPMAVLVIAGIISFCPGKISPEPRLARRPVSAPASLAPAADAGGSIGERA